MSKYIGDYAEDATLNFKFHSKNLSQVPTTLAGTPAIKIYKDDSTTTESTAGVTLTVDFDSVTGLNNLKVDLSSDAFYAVGSDYHAVITTGTVDSISVVGAVVCTFSIENRFDEVDLVKIGGSATVDGVGIVAMFRKMISVLWGKVNRTGDVYTYLKQDATTTEQTHTISTSGRTIS